MGHRTIEEIDADLAAYRVRRQATLDQLFASMLMLNAIDSRVEVLLDQRHTARAGA
ncbi:hypothetical protein QOZ88_05900 [Blastococcus sp. BMG 814]|uniref:Uncharacterized protein n=1 Tax=Blastococcus carthaginiensis TaxID=3050034 RepID=A0ABT9I9B6_9ACTN|nr:hypothetical protein [Blastococcus carthaginiensis]MDP5182163.1 hypothetical protein [Blastococcus carthaginiensis]